MKVDSFAVACLGEINSALFDREQGLLVDVQQGHFLLIDSLGNILKETEFPQEGPGSVSRVGGIIRHGDRYFFNTLAGEIVVLNQDLTLDRKIAMPFPSESRDMRGNFPIPKEIFHFLRMLIGLQMDMAKAVRTIIPF